MIMPPKNPTPYKVNKGNFPATLIRFNQNLNYEKIYVFRRQMYDPFFSRASAAISFSEKVLQI
jgi:hypothetical protein